MSHVWIIIILLHLSACHTCVISVSLKEIQSDVILTSIFTCHIPDLIPAVPDSTNLSSTSYTGFGVASKIGWRMGSNSVRCFINQFRTDLLVKHQFGSSSPASMSSWMTLSWRKICLQRVGWGLDLGTLLKRCL